MNLLLNEIQDRYVRENFKRLQEFLRVSNMLEGFTFVEIELTQAVTNYRYYHGLGYIPQDIIQTRFTGPGELTFNYSRFDRQYLDLSTTGACTVRALVGTIKSEKAGRDG